MRLSEDGRSLFVLNTPDGKLSIFDVSNAENPRPVLVSEIPVGLEPVSLAHLDAGDEPADVGFAGGRLFVSYRISNMLAVVEARSGEVLSEVEAGSFDPPPARVKAGRGFLYDMRLSGNGTVSCAICHVDADRDGTARDLGDPGGEMVYIEGESRVIHDPSGNDQDPVKELRALHPIKGAKVTPSMRGMLMERPWCRTRRWSGASRRATRCSTGGETGRR